MAKELVTTGTVRVVTGSRMVYGSSSVDWSQYSVRQGYKFLNTSEVGGNTYTVATVLSATKLQLSASYVEASALGQNYKLTRSFTPYRNYMRPFKGDTDFLSGVRTNFVYKIDKDVNSVVASISGTSATRFSCGTITATHLIVNASILPRGGLLQVVATGAAGFATTKGDWSFSFAKPSRVEATWYEHTSATQITIQKDGWYRVGYNLAFRNHQWRPTNIRSWVKTNTSGTIFSSITYGAIDNTKNASIGGNSNHCECLTNLSASDIVSLRIDFAILNLGFGASSNYSATSMASQSWLWMEFV